MSVEALWSVEFKSNLQLFGSGVVIFETGRVFGGDSTFYYVGDYEVRNNEIEGLISITNYSGNNHSVIGSGNNFNIRLKGPIKSPKMELAGHRVDAPDVKVIVSLIRRAELPNPK